MPVYAWKRFWRQLDAEFLTEDNGYLYDPKSLYGTSLNLNSAPLTSFADCPCLVMLGEPGIGKSTEFESEFSRVEQEAALRGDMALRYDLKEYQTDSRLVADAFDNDDIRAWKGEKRLLHLFFDSLDEGRLEVRNIATVIAGQLKRLAAQSDRLRLRIACRTAEWLLTLEQSLKEIWKDENVAIIQLNPLRRLDVIEAARTEGIQSDGFLENIAEKNLQTFAANPITLKFLIDIYRNAGELPSTKHQLYEQGCLRLCEESSLSRRDAGHFGQISAAQRLEIASRIAAVSIFCGRSAIVTSPQFSPSADHLTVVELAGGTEQVSGDQFAVSENAIREALSTTLFSGRGPQRLGFAHRTYAEFLAARYAERRGLDLTQTKSLFFHPECETKIVPQLSETAAWIAIGNRSLFEEIMSGDPLVLLRSDVATTDDQLKARFIARLLNGFDDEEMDDSDWGLRDYYANLKHPQLADQLEPFIRDRTKNRVTRRFVVDIAEKCRETGLLKALLAIALDPSDDAHIRAQAAHAILIIGDRSAYESLKPLALGLAGPDPDDELRGNALTALWPNRLITADELFAALEQPQNPSLIGAYRIFLKVEFPNHLQKDDLEAALRWCRKQAALPDMPGELDQFENAVSEILRKSLSCLADPKIVAAIADCLAALIEHRDHAPIKGELFESLETPARRKIIEALIPKLCNPEEAAFYLVFGHVSLLQAGDFNWLLEQSALADSDHEKRVWAKIARRQFDHRERSQLDQLLANCSSSPIVADVFSDLLQSIDLRSPEATKMRTEHARLQKLEKRSRIRQAPALLEPPPDVRVKNCLDQLEAGDLQGWQLLNRELQLEPSSRLYEFDCEADLTKLPGWIAADESTRSRILAAAKHYLTSWQSNSDAWLGKNVYHFPDFAGYRALVLVDSLEPRFIENLSSSRWVNVAPSIVGFPAYSRQDQYDKATQKRLLETAYQHAPDQIIAALIKIIDRRSSADDANGSIHLHELSRVENCWDDRLTAALLAKAKDRPLKPSLIGDLLEELINHGSADAIEYAESLVAKRENEIAKALAQQAAAVLWGNAGGAAQNALLQQFQCDRSFFRDVITLVAQGLRQTRRAASELLENELADLYLLLAQEFPHHEDERESKMHFVGPRESVAEYRDRILTLLSNRGTTAACSALEQIKIALPHLDFLDWAIRAARRVTLQSTWNPMEIHQARGLLSHCGARLVRNGRDLQRVIVESLGRLQHCLIGETPAVRDVWDHNRQEKLWEPIDENAFSDYIARHLRNDLRHCGIVALREVEIRRGNVQEGERTDIYATASIFDSTRSAIDVGRVIIEVKGCWNQELKTAMETQLKNRYLKDNNCNHGLYVVGWFLCDSWNFKDSRRKNTPKWPVEQAREFFGDQQKQLSDEKVYIESVILDVTLI